MSSGQQGFTEQYSGFVPLPSTCSMVPVYKHICRQLLAEDTRDCFCAGVV